MTAYTELLTLELALERNRSDDNAGAQRSVRAVYAHGANLTHYLAAAEVATGFAGNGRRPRGGPSGARGPVGTTRSAPVRPGWIRRSPRCASRCCSTPAASARHNGRGRPRALPTVDAGCLDLGTLGWRGAEAVACARVRLLALNGDRAAAERLERALAHLAAERGPAPHAPAFPSPSGAPRPRRPGAPTRPRRQRPSTCSTSALADYARPLVRTGAAAIAALERILDAEPAAPQANAAAGLLAMARRDHSERAAPRRPADGGAAPAGETARTRRSPGRSGCRRTASATASARSSGSSTWPAAKMPCAARGRWASCRPFPAAR